ncbi:MAG: enoyl-CoA hydratase-related protein [Spongiibacteraceae bacterium]
MTNYTQIHYAVATESGINRDGGGMVALRLFNLKKPTIAAMNGTAAGVGITMTLPMDIRVTSDNAKFTFPFTRRGIVPESCSSTVSCKNARRNFC